MTRRGAAQENRRKPLQRSRPSRTTPRASSARTAPRRSWHAPAKLPGLRREPPCRRGSGPILRDRAGGRVVCSVEGGRLQILRWGEGGWRHFFCGKGHSHNKPEGAGDRGSRDYCIFSWMGVGLSSSFPLDEGLGNSVKQNCGIMAACANAAVSFGCGSASRLCAGLGVAWQYLLMAIASSFSRFHQTTGSGWGCLVYTQYSHCHHILCDS